MLSSILSQRSKILAQIDKWFYLNDFVKVETPVHIAAPAPEPHIDCPKCDGGWLRASPELQMKKLLAHGMERIFQIGPCFRAGEKGSRHNPEFTMLEWYRANEGYEVILEDTLALVRFAAKSVHGSPTIKFQDNTIDFDKPPIVKTVREAYLEWASWDPVADFDQDRFDEDMALKIEPAIPKNTLFILKDYPKEAASLARLKPEDNRVAERWELYIGGIETANAYGELTDGKEQRSRFLKAKRERVLLGEDDYPLDEEFLCLLESGAFPPCSGIALGIDRLIMILLDRPSIGDVRVL